ncbi:MAG: hypothetical protein QM699_14505 [Amaricoccus sp.]|uniref:hypothetical protein n=1 Tax=Amaricoccus sp. TaxID=1872485 RepID=UPI0039E3350E
MRRLLAMLSVLALALPAGAAPLGPSSFEAMAEGRTLRFVARDGAPFGAEQYFPGRRSLWQYPDGSCAEGRWWPEGDDVCFSYGVGAGRECWSFEAGPTGISVRLVSGSDGAPAGSLVIDLAGVDRVPLECPGPDVGT